MQNSGPYSRAPLPVARAGLEPTTIRFVRYDVILASPLFCVSKCLCLNPVTTQLPKELWEKRDIMGARNQDSFHTLSLCNMCISLSLSLSKIMKTKSCLCILIPPIIPWAKYRAWDLSDLLWYSLGIRRSKCWINSLDDDSWSRMDKNSFFFLYFISEERSIVH